MLYDYLSRPVKPQQLTREHAAPSLTGVRSIWNETVASGLTPQRLASLLMAAADGDHSAYLTLAEEMEERDLHYAAELGKRKLAVSRLPITVESATDSARDKALADAVRTLIKGTGFRSLLKDLLDAIGKGFSVVEMMWATGSQWKPQRYEWRDPRFFQFDQVSRRQIRLRDELDSFNGLELAPYKFLTHVHHGKSGIPIRGGLARLAAWAFMCKGYTIKDWLAFAEVFGMPLRLGKYGPNAHKDEINILKMAVANLGIDAAAVFPESMQVELVEAGNKGGSGDFFERLANYLDNQISKGILGQTASSSGTPGKLGNEELQAEVRDDIRDDDAEQLEETINRDLVRPFIDLNFGPQEQYPEIQLRAIPPEDVKALVEAVEKLVPLGLRVEQSVMCDKLGLPDVDPSAKPEDLLRPAGTQNQSKMDEETVEAPPEKQLPSHTARNSQQSDPDEQLAIDDMIASVTDAALQGQADAILAGLLKQITEGGDYTEAMTWLAEAEPTMDSSAMEAMLGRALFIAETWGRINGGRD
jgi:phage gp29-like protein